MRRQLQKGSGMMILVVGLSALSVLSVGILSQRGLELFRRSAGAYSEWEVNLANQRALSLGGYFVAHNLVLCREEGWKDLSEKEKCRWGGNFHQKKIAPEDFNILSVNNDAEGALVLTLRSSEEGWGAYETQLRLSLVNWSQDPALRSVVGEVPVQNAYADDDRYMVMMVAATDLLLPDKRTKQVVKMGALRRPIASPNIQILMGGDRGTCLFECVSGDVLAPYPDCRGPLETPKDMGHAAVNVRVTNNGPGAMYRLAYERITTYNPEVYPARPPERQLVDVMSQREVFMPGEKVDTEVERKCYAPKQVQTTVNATNVVSGGFNSPQGDVTVASSLRNLSSESFDLNVARFNVDEAAKNPADFAKNYDPYNPQTYVPNDSPSILEPRRLGSEITTLHIDSPEETITTTTVQVNPRFGGRTGGDGRGGGN